MPQSTYIIDPKEHKPDYSSYGCMTICIVAFAGFAMLGVSIVFKGDMGGWIFFGFGSFLSFILVCFLFAGQKREILQLDDDNYLTVAKGDPKNIKFRHSSGLLLTITLEFYDRGSDSGESVYTLNMLTPYERVMLGQYVQVEEKSEILHELVEWLGNENGFKIRWRNDFTKESGAVNISEA